MTVLYHSEPDLAVYQGDVLETLAGLADESVHCVVTSPPYWGLRDYGTGEWTGGDPDCDHSAVRREHGEHEKQASSAGTSRDPIRGGGCRKCGATRIDRQIGLEQTPELYVARMVEVFREVRRVLRADGTCWLNLGDSYAASSTYNTTNSLHTEHGWKQDADRRPNVRAVDGLKPKDLVGIPWRVAFALQADGWCLRSEVIWAKPNPMPESVTDRPTKAHEQLFLLTKSTWKGGPIQPWPMNREDAVWLAALVDGEGSICFQERERAEYANHIGPRLSIVNTHRALLQRVTEITSLDLNETPQPRTRSNGDVGRPVYSWQVTNEKAARIIAAIRPHLIAKRDQAEIALYVHVLNQKHKGRGGHGNTDADLERKRQAAAACSALNHGQAVDLSWLSPVATGRWVPNPYYFDADAIRETWADDRNGASGATRSKFAAAGAMRQDGGVTQVPQVDGRNARSVWEIVTQPYAEAHFATFPEELPRRCIAAGTSERGCCPVCGAPWERVVERVPMVVRPSPRRAGWQAADDYAQTQVGGTMLEPPTSRTVGWEPACVHGRPPVPCTVLDPFGGAGTTALVARRLGRASVAVELNPEYAALIVKRLATWWKRPALPPEAPTDQMSLLDMAE